jgi:carbamoylphosphate synthase large subunit
MALLRADDRLRRDQDPALRLEKFPGAEAARPMQSVGEVMSIGRTFRRVLRQGDALA